MLDIEAIQKILPQRFPFLMIDMVIELEPAKKVVALKNVSMNEEFFRGHFPKKPVMPGVLILEAMAQTAIALLYSEKEEDQAKKKVYYIGSLKSRFFNPVFPGDQLMITVEPVKLISNAAIVNAKAVVGDKEIASAEIGFMVK